MATFPRVGVINLDFKDVSKMAKDIEANDPLKNAIATAGKVLSDRERDILYRRALAEAQGKEVPDETTLIEAFGKGADKVAEGASWLKDKWDRLDIRSPFEETLTPGTVTESPITETPSEKGSREMIGYKPNQSPIETDKYRTNLKAPDRADVQPNDELSFGFSQDVGQAEEQPSPIIPFATGEQVPEQTGVRVDFGTSEPGLKLRSPFAMRPKEEAQEVVSPIEDEEGATEKLKAPVDQKTQMEAWSEMNRLDPNRAAFDYQRIKDENVLANEIAKRVAESKEDSDIDSAKNVKEMAIQFRNYAGAISSANWNNFTDTEKAAIKNGYQGLRTQLSKTDLGRALLGEVEAEAGTGAVGSNPPPPPPIAVFDKKAAIAAIDNIIKEKDNPKTTSQEWVANAKVYLDDVSKGMSASDPDVASVSQYITEKAAELSSVVAEKRETARYASETAKVDAKDRISQDKEFKPLWVSMANLNRDPSLTNKRSSVNTALRVESGAAIAASEFDNLMSTVLPEAAYQRYKRESTGILPTLAGLVDEGAMKRYLEKVAENYLGDIDAKRLYNYLDAKVADNYYKRFQKTLGGGGGIPAPGDTPAPDKVGGFTVKKRIQ